MPQDNLLDKLPVSRRNALIGGLSVVAVAALVGGYIFSGSPSSPPQVVKADQTDAKFADLMQPGQLPENSTGNEKAPVTIIEYSSMSCPHCAAFHKNTLPNLKKKYIDTGKVRYIIREFPLNNPALAAAMLARCTGKEKFFPFVEVLYDKQEQWAFGQQGEVENQLFEISKQAGFTKDEFLECFKNDTLFKGIMAVRERGSKQFGVNSTPTFFINGKMMTGSQNFDDFEKIIEPILSNS